MTPSNNLKESLIKELGAFFTAMCQSQGSDTPVSDERRDKEKATAQILNLILDTILASEEMQDEPIADDLSPIVKAAYLASNGTKADLRTMLEGMK